MLWKQSVMFLFTSSSQRHHHFPISIQVLRFHYSFLRPCPWQWGRGPRIPTWEKWGLCKSCPPLKGWDNLMASQILVCPLPIPMPASGLQYTDLTSFFQPTSPAPDHYVPPSHWRITVPLADMSGRAPPWLVDIISSYEDKSRVRRITGGEKTKSKARSRDKASLVSTFTLPGLVDVTNGWVRVSQSHCSLPLQRRGGEGRRRVLRMVLTQFWTTSLSSNFPTSPWTQIV